MATRIFPLALMFWSGLLAATPSSMEIIDDATLSGIVAQGLIVTDRVTGSELPGANMYSTPFNFYRMGLDGVLGLNMNISKLQLGCGGINDQLTGFVGCDVDIDYATLMGRNGTQLGSPKSLFNLTRPYLEIAIKNDGSRTQREIAGIKIGAQSADGALSIGRVYNANGINQENMLQNNCNTAASTGAGVVGCHSGINAVSGFLGAEMSLAMRVTARVCSLGIVFGACLGAINLDAVGCVGRTNYTGDNCGTSRGDAFFTELAGTRMQGLGLRAAELDLTGGGAVALLEALGLNNVYAQLNASLRLVHRLTFEETGDFFLSFQREPIAYPRYAKITPIQEMTANGTMSTAFDACAIAAYQTPRCSSAYAVPANTGWWMNLPSVKLLDVNNLSGNNLGDLTVGQALSLLGAPGYLIEHAEFALAPARNCYGSTMFC
jgi:hypothetical protein